jgi:PIN domain nuclease of toxin-antitoxin system
MVTVFIEVKFKLKLTICNRHHQIAHCRRLQQLPWRHRDPFDRMLIAQAQVEDFVIVTADRRFKKYGVAVIW